MKNPKYLAVISILTLLGLVILSGFTSKILSINNSSLYYYFHFLGGLFTATFFFSISLINSREKIKFSRRAVLVLILTMIVGVLWEVKEFIELGLLDNTTIDHEDTLYDLISDLGGGIFAIYILYLNSAKDIKTA